MNSNSPPAENSDMDPGRGSIQVIERAAAILRALKRDPSGMSLGQLAKAVGLPRSTVQRIVNALRNEQMVIANSKGRDLRLGPEIYSLASATSFDILDICRDALTEISAATGETADLSVLRDTFMVFLEQTSGIHRLRAVSAVGDKFPLTNTANGRACLSQLPPARALELAEVDWDRLGVKGDGARLDTDLADIRNRRLAYDLDEHTNGISAIGFAVCDWAGTPYAISVPMPSARYSSVRDIVEQTLRKALADITDKLTDLRGQNTRRVPYSE